MKPSCVLDASVIARWWVGEKDSLQAAALFFLRAHRDGKVEVRSPDIALAEVGNVFWRAVRFHDWPPAVAEEASRDLLDLGLAIHPASELLSDAMAIAIAHGVTVYDALYVALSRRLGLPLYTADRRLADAIGAPVAEVRWLGAS